MISAIHLGFSSSAFFQAGQDLPIKRVAAGEKAWVTRQQHQPDAGGSTMRDYTTYETIIGPVRGGDSLPDGTVH